MRPSEDPNCALYPTLRFVLSVLSFLEEQYMNSFNADIFDNLVQNVKSLYKCDYEKEKYTIVITENLSINFANYVLRVKITSVDSKEDITKRILRYFSEKNGKSAKHKEYFEDIVSDIEKLTGRVYEPEEKETKSKSLSHIFYGSQAAIYNDWGLKYKLQQKYSYAICSFTMASIFQPRNEMFLSNRAGVHLKLKNYARVISDALAAMSINPFTKAHDYVGELCMELGFYEDAADIYEELSKMEPNNSTYTLKICKALQHEFFDKELEKPEESFYEDAADIYEELSKMEPNNSTYTLKICKALQHEFFDKELEKPEESKEAEHINILGFYL